MPRSGFRHHKQRWNADATFVFTRRMRVGEAKAPWVPAGTVVDKAKFARFLKRWWDAGLIEIQGWTVEGGRKALQEAQDRRRKPKAPPPVAPAAPEAPPPPPAAAPEAPPPVPEAPPPAAEAPPAELPDAEAEQELANDEAARGLKPLGKGLFQLPDGSKVKGRRKAIEALQAWKAKGS